MAKRIVRQAAAATKPTKRARYAAGSAAMDLECALGGGPADCGCTERDKWARFAGWLAEGFHVCKGERATGNGWFCQHQVEQGTKCSKVLTIAQEIERAERKLAYLGKIGRPTGALEGKIARLRAQSDPIPNPSIERLLEDAKQLTGGIEWTIQDLELAVKHYAGVAA